MTAFKANSTGLASLIRLTLRPVCCYSGKQQGYSVRTTMDSIEFLLIVAVFAVVLFWYLQNAERGSDGLIGLLALEDDPDEAKGIKKQSYRLKDRPDRSKAAMRDIRKEHHAQRSYRFKDGEELSREERLKQRFRRQDEARYRVKDKAANYKARKGPSD
ncbi:hypothetical protein PUV54_05685 [Hyphococcus flavus]|uniref:Uncharacterized protein n=1 Tax=Hyphococcus flavus TaxID=1866326 RepID=A0AAE9ZH43_9PROT|nr:hypothetical protein [Hyphococcus flavus]WDI32687.1 hypothetical protein PUV54_05685 [Hyphococcus flavus]